MNRLSTDKEFKSQFVETEFWRERPLKIAARSDAATLVGYKSPWDKAHCKTAIEQRHMYEAAINIDWLKPFSADADDADIAGDPLTYADVETIRCNLMVICDEVLSEVAQTSSTDVPVEHRRYFFPAGMSHTGCWKFREGCLLSRVSVVGWPCLRVCMVAPSLPPAQHSSTVAEQHDRPAPAS